MYHFMYVSQSQQNNKQNLLKVNHIHIFGANLYS